MIATWYAVLAAMLTTYAVLDGFDFGAGILQFTVAKTNEERRHVLAAIGPLWDGNEVWLLASGGVFVFAFPGAYAAAFSGLYLALMLVLWLLVLRGLAIEFRGKSAHPLWIAAMDTTFGVASTVMALVLGVAIGNLIRGVPLDRSGYFHQDLFAAAQAEGRGSVDPFTAVFGIFGVVAFAAHGATFLVWKTTGAVEQRSRVWARRLWIATFAIALLATVLTAFAQPSFFDRFLSRRWLWPLPVVAGVAPLAALRMLDRRRDLAAFLASCAFIAALLVATAGTLFPVILRSSLNDAYTITAYTAASSSYGLEVGLALWLPAIVLAIGYFSYVFRAFRGKVDVSDSHY